MTPMEHAILMFLYKTGARVSEVTQLRVGMRGARPGARQQTPEGKAGL